MKQKRYTTSLTIAGSDSGGGAGIQADIKTFSSLGVYGTSVISAITAQNTLGVTAVMPVSVDIIAAQLDAVFSDFKIDSIKIGMLFSEEIIKTIADKLSFYTPQNIVLDPVMKASSGDSLVRENILSLYKTLLFPKITLLTPNIDEAILFTGIIIKSKEDMIKAGRSLIAMGCNAVLMKGGHLESETSEDILLLHTGEIFFYDSERIMTDNSHGTGCTLSSAIAAFMAHGLDIKESVRKAKGYLFQALNTGKEFKTGKGTGPLNHFYDPMPLTAKDEFSSKVI